MTGRQTRMFFAVGTFLFAAIFLGLTFDSWLSDNRRIIEVEKEALVFVIRHVTGSLMKESARHRLLLVLSDGKPNDIDEYEGRYGIEDTRQAVAEVRLQGAHPFCVTVDRDAPVYIQRTFGPGAYSVLRRPETLPQTLVQVLRRLLNS